MTIIIIIIIIHIIVRRSGSLENVGKTKNPVFWISPPPGGGGLLIRIFSDFALFSVAIIATPRESALHASIGNGSAMIPPRRGGSEFLFNERVVL